MRTDVPSESREGAVIRLAAVGDHHLSPDRAGRFRPCVVWVHRHTDVVLLAGDFTEQGSAAHAARLAGGVRATVRSMRWRSQGPWQNGRTRG